MATALIESAKNGQLEVIRRLVLDGYDVNHRGSPDGATALYWSACNGHLATCDWLIRHGADVNLSVEKSGSIPLHGAADRGHVDCVLLLIRRGSSIDTKTRSNGDTPLHLAAYRGHAAVCRVLLQNGACADIVNTQGCTALDEAQIQNHYDIFQLLCRHRQQKRFSSHLRKSETCQLNPTVNRSKAFHKSKKLITEVLSRPSDWDDAEQRISSSSLSFNHLLSGDSSTTETDGVKHPTELESTLQSLESCRETSEVNFASETCDQNIPPSQSVPPFSFFVETSSKTDDVIRELIMKFNRLVEYSSDLQVQLTVRDDEKDRLLRENGNLLERLECCKKIAEAVEVSNRARKESERRAQRAENEMIVLQQRIEALEKSNRLLRVASNSGYSSTRYSGYEGNFELQPRGMECD